MADLLVDMAQESEIGKNYGDKYSKSRVVEDAYEAEDFFPHLGENGKWLFFYGRRPLKDLNGKS